MATPLQPRGPLPARVYWIRRLLVAAAAVLLVVGVARLLGGGSDASSGADGQAALSSDTQQTEETQQSEGPAAGESEGAEESEAPEESGEPTATSSPTEKRTRKTLPPPTGECAPSDIVVDPRVRNAEAGSDVAIKLRLRTQEAEACTWQFSAETMAVKITSGADDIWSSRECPKVLPTEDVVVRSGGWTPVQMVWNARRSDDDCTKFTDWAMPGDYHVIAAALAGEPTDLQFTLGQAVSETVTKTITPKAKPKPKPDGSRSGKPPKERERNQHRPGDDGEGNSQG